MAAKMTDQQKKYTYKNILLATLDVTILAQREMQIFHQNVSLYSLLLSFFLATVLQIVQSLRNHKTTH